MSTSMVLTDKHKQTKDMIRSHLDNPRFPQQSWGFSLVRCTYSSQERFDEFVDLVTEDAMEYLGHDLDEDLRSTIQLKVIQDESLEGATWKEARNRFDEAIREELDRKLKDIPPDDMYWGIVRDKKDVREELVWTQPGWQFFIFVDKESMASVVDCTDPDEMEPEPAYTHAYVRSNFVDEASTNTVVDSTDAGGEEPGPWNYVTLVQSGFVARGLDCEDVDESGPVDDCEKHENCRMMRYQRFKAWDIVSFFASILNQDWYEHYEVDDKGISIVIRV